MRRLLCSLFLLLALFPLCAGTLRVGLLCTQGTEDFASTVSNTLFSLLGSNSRLEIVNYSRHIAESDAEEARRVHSDLAQEREGAAYSAPEYVPYWQSDPICEPVSLDWDETFIRERSQSMLSYSMLDQNLDLILAFVQVSEGQIGELDVYMYIEGRTEEVFNSLFVAGSLDSLAGPVLSSLVSHFTEDSVLCDVSAFPSGTLSDSLSGEEIIRSGQWALVDLSTTSITVASSGYQSLTVEVDTSAKPYPVLEGSLIEEDIGSVSLQAFPSGTKASLFGLSADLPLSASFQSGALIVSLSNEGFKTENLQLTPQSRFHSVMLRPQWMAQEGRTGEAKDEMYRSMRNSLLSFGLYVIMSSLSQIWPQAAPVADLVTPLAAGISIVNLIDFIHDAMAYYDSAKQVYL